MENQHTTEGQTITEIEGGSTAKEGVETPHNFQAENPPISEEKPNVSLADLEDALQESA